MKLLKLREDCERLLTSFEFCLISLSTSPVKICNINGQKVIEIITMN